MIHHIFISYSRSDRDKAATIAERLESVGWPTWYDQRIRAGQVFDRMIEDALTRAACVLVLWSQHSVESEWVRAQAADGLKRGILLPAIIDVNVTLPLRFRQVQGVDLSRWNGAATAEELNDVVHDIDALLKRNSVAESLDTANTLHVNAPSVVSALRAAGENDQQIVKLLAAGKVKKVALTACMHKLLTILNAMLKHRTPWQPQDVQR